jgi:hypothetical protein
MQRASRRVERASPESVARAAEYAALGPNAKYELGR